MARTRDEDAARRILDATRTLIAERGPAAATISEIASAAGVGRQTIYRWWPTRSALVIDALIEMTDAEMPFEATGNTVKDLRRQMRSMVQAFGGPAGALIKELLGAAQSDPHIAEVFRTRFFDHRRDQARAFLAAASEAEEYPFTGTRDTDALIYGLYAPLWLALLIGHEPLTPKLADRALDNVLPAGTR